MQTSTTPMLLLLLLSVSDKPSFFSLTPVPSAGSSSGLSFGHNSHLLSQHGRWHLQQHLLLLWPGLLFLLLSHDFLPHAGAEGGLHLRPNPLHLPGPTDSPLLPDPAGPVPEHAIIHVDRLHGEGHVWLPDFLTGSLRDGDPDGQTGGLRQHRTQKQVHFPLVVTDL